MSLSSIKLNKKKINQFAKLIAELKDVKPFPFIDFKTEGPRKYPAVGDKNVVDYFFAETIQNFGFWYGDEKGYVKPMYAKIYGKLEKGSDFHHYAWMRAYKENPDFIKPETQASLELKDMKYLYRDDEGNCPIPMLEERLKLANDYGDKMEKGGFKSTTEFLEISEGYLINDGHGLFEILDNFKAYGEDPLRKKSNLLRVILENRPEKLLEVKDPENKGPMIDYHIQRIMLRTGMIGAGDYEEIIKERRWIDKKVHDKIRETCHKAFMELVKKSGKSIAGVDYMLFSARRYCPEMETPSCSKCSFNSICEKRIELFQPVFRTTYY